MNEKLRRPHEVREYDLAMTRDPIHHRDRLVGPAAVVDEVPVNIEVVEGSRCQRQGQRYRTA